MQPKKCTPKPPPFFAAELPSFPKIKQQSSITNPHSETGHFHIKSMPKCVKIGAASTAGWGAGAAIFSPVGRVVLLHYGLWPTRSSRESRHLDVETRPRFHFARDTADTRAPSWVLQQHVTPQITFGFVHLRRPLRESTAYFSLHQSSSCCLHLVQPTKFAWVHVTSARAS